ncbi:uncharacterized protein AMSG_11448 [Thecamonas trahens ATCC 50062]|uniref:SH3 domain-containing protein n=1 Tax=Thecamonas trahens ATCC 50062 TaxID=461836 RepID=A0A0L0DVU7_THETB|nr:hypothetical protein AMSG_11448 [Thecamonas trahens ATCC 50062]KNC56201.1 hypothetical protein AMSG_11448 [Thecamonas trahens ATCC 50062]|eukprot:XP_013752678.1 hypothetical protein AMSG_11448 [Thecamonas trahens ATCC 50062]
MATIKVKSVFDYTAENDDELSFDVGEIIQVLNNDDAGWWVGVILKGGKARGEKGWFPSNFVEPYNEADDSANEDPPPLPKRSKAAAPPLLLLLLLPLRRRPRPRAPIRPRQGRRTKPRLCLRVERRRPPPPSGRVRRPERWLSVPWRPCPLRRPCRARARHRQSPTCRLMRRPRQTARGRRPWA